MPCTLLVLLQCIVSPTTAPDSLPDEEEARLPVPTVTSDDL
jgi:hypothetical protein